VCHDLASVGAGVKRRAEYTHCSRPQLKGTPVNTKTTIALLCYVGAMAGPGIFGLMFLFRSEFMPYHADAVGVPWPEVPKPFQTLILALLKLAGGAWLTVAVAELVLLFGPFRHGARWTLWAVPALGLLHWAGVCYAMAYVTLNTPARPPWIPAIASITLLLAGAALSMSAERQLGGSDGPLTAGPQRPGR
jgi:hypothetical protein